MTAESFKGLNRSVKVFKELESTLGIGIRQKAWLLYLSVALISVCILMLEIGLTRIFSVMFEFHYAFLVISSAILGLGVGGIVVYARTRKISDPDLKPLENLLPLSSVGMAVSILLMTVPLVKVSLFFRYPVFHR